MPQPSLHPDRLGWKRDKPDGRDFHFCPHPAATGLPTAVDLTAKINFTYNQGNQGSCVGNATCGLYRYLHPDENPSRAMTYWGARSIEGSADQDSGCEIRDAMRWLSGHGVCSDALMPYSDQDYTSAPSAAAYHDAITRKTFAKVYARVPQTLVALRSCLAHGHPFAFGFNIYNSFIDGAQGSGVMPMPDPGEDVQGGHAVWAVGYDTVRAAFRIKNSWGTDWGEHGYFWMPDAFITSSGYCSDFWVLKATGA